MCENDSFDDRKTRVHGSAAIRGFPAVLSPEAP
jgi:hypothetical protein